MDDHDMEDPLDNTSPKIVEPLLDDLPLELHFEIYKEVFRSNKYDVDLTRLGSRKAPDWVNSLFLWQLYWRTVRLYVPGEAWYRVDRKHLGSGHPGGMYLQPWRMSLKRMLKFAHRLFCYPEQVPLDPDASREEFPHPARLRNTKPPKSIEFEVLCIFDHKGAVDGAHRPIFRTRDEITNIRALLWLFKILKCQHTENRHRLDIALKWKDIRYTKPKALVLEYHGGQENMYAYQEDPDYPTKAAIPEGLGIKERYMQVIQEGLEMWSGYLLDREARDSLSEAQKAEGLHGKHWKPIRDSVPKTVKIGMVCARKGIHQRNFVNRLALNICHNLRTQVIDYNDNFQLAYLEFWQRVSLNIPPVLPGEMYYNGLTQEFLGYLETQVGYSGSAIWEFNADPKAFVVKHKVKPQGEQFFRNRVDCHWELEDYWSLGAQPRKPWNDDSESDW